LVSATLQSAEGVSELSNSKQSGLQHRGEREDKTTNLQLLSPKDADKRLRLSGGVAEDHVHCCDGTLDDGAAVRLRACVM
jgi:hypothetical protein